MFLLPIKKKGFLYEESTDSGSHVKVYKQLGYSDNTLIFHNKIIISWDLKLDLFKIILTGFCSIHFIGQLVEFIFVRNLK